LSAPPRPLYESPADRAHETDIAGGVAFAWGFTARKLPMQYRIDFALLDGASVAAFIEVKDRSRYRSDAFETLILSAAKYEAAISFSRAFGLPVFVAARWSDRTGVYLVQPSSASRLAFAGRRDRGDWQDEEPCVHLLARLFHDPLSLAPGGPRR